MEKTVQKRTLKTRAALVDAAQKVIARHGFEALRVEQVVQGAGVAKGTFFAHFRDKEALMDRLIGARIDAILDELEAGPVPKGVEGMVAALMPLLNFMTCERYVFDVILRHSGAAALEDVGPIAMTFSRQDKIVRGWIEAGDYRRDVDAKLLGEGVQAFMIQTIALMFCALHSSTEMESRLTGYLRAWLEVVG